MKHDDYSYYNEKLELRIDINYSSYILNKFNSYTIRDTIYS
jgi:hypothetical protein